MLCNRTCHHFTQIRFPNVCNLKNHGCLCKLGSSQFILSGLVFRFSKGCTHPKNSNGIQNWNTHFFASDDFPFAKWVHLQPSTLILYVCLSTFCKVFATQKQISLRLKDIEDSDIPIHTRMNNFTSIYKGSLVANLRFHEVTDDDRSVRGRFKRDVGNGRKTDVRLGLVERI